MQTDLGVTQHRRDTAGGRLAVLLQLRVPAGQQPVRPAGRLCLARQHLQSVFQRHAPQRQSYRGVPGSHRCPRGARAALRGAVSPDGRNKPSELAWKEQLVPLAPRPGLRGGPACVLCSASRFLSCAVAGMGRRGVGGSSHSSLCCLQKKRGGGAGRDERWE